MSESLEQRLYSEKYLSLVPELEIITKGALQDESIFQLVVRQLNGDFLRCDECMHLYYIWAPLIETYNKCGKRLSCDFLLAKLAAFLQKSPGSKAHHRAYNLIKEAKEGPKVEPGPAEVILERLALLAELYYRRLLNFELSSVNGKVGALAEIINRIEPHYRRSISRPAQDIGEIDLFAFQDQSVVIRHPYYVEFVDYLLDRGSVHPEVCLLIGPTGSGKSFLSLQLCTQWALANKDPNKICAYFSYELDLPKLIPRIGAQLCRISIEEFEQIRRIPAEQLDDETRRKLELATEAKQYIRCYDFSGYFHAKQAGVDDPIYVYGCGGIPEVVTMLEQEVEKGKKIEFVIIDWVGAAILAQNQSIKDNSVFIRLHQDFAVQALRHIAAPFDCAVWLVHQVAGARESKGSRVPIHHSEASWSKNMAQVVSNAITLSKANNQGIQVLIASKTRNASRRNPVCIQFNPVTTLFERADKSFGIDYDSNILVEIPG